MAEGGTVSASATLARAAPMIAVAVQGFTEVCETMFGISLAAEGEPERLRGDGLALGASNSLIIPGGGWEIGLFGSEQSLYGITRAMLAMEPDEEVPLSDVLDALREFVNMVSGHVKRAGSRLMNVPSGQIQIGVPLFLLNEDCAKFVPRRLPALAQSLSSPQFEGRVLLVVSDRRALGLCEEIDAILEDGAEDKHALGQVLSLFEEFTEAVPEIAKALRAWAQECSALVMQVINEELPDHEAQALGWVREGVGAALGTLAEGRLERFELPRAKPDFSASDEDAPLGPPVERDPETIETLGEFITESEEGLDRCDQILMGIESGAQDPDAINALFRVFHTIKGVAAFVEVTEAQSLAHTTETLLAKSRDGKLDLVTTPGAMDVVFESVEAMRAQISAARRAVEASRGFMRSPGLPGLLGRLEAVIRGEVPPPSAGSRARATQAGAAPRATVMPKAIKETVKIDVEVVERLTHVAATLGALEARLASRVDEASRAAFSDLWKATAEVREIGALMSAVSVSGLFQKMSRMVRDLSKKTGKLARVVLQGEETTAPRGMVEKLGDPLVHMIRNALDHGIEDTDGRRASGKALLATVGLSAVRDERTVTIELSDDGRGIDASRVLKKALDKGIVSPDADLSESDVFLLIFAPGFSTAEQVTALSGRGVGMDVVKRNIESLGGRIEISSRLGQGTRFKMVLPLVG